MSNGKRYAVIIGVSKYEDDGFPALPYAKNDAIRVARALVTVGGFKKEQVYLLVNDVSAPTTDFQYFAPTRSNVLEKLKIVADDASQDDLVLVFFAGHGVEASKNPYLLSCDTKMNVLAHTGVRVVEDMNDILGKSSAKTILRIFDSCRSPFGGTRTVMECMTKGFEDALMYHGSGWASFSSCSSGEVSYESSELEQGVFSYYVCEGLEGKAANENGVVTFDSLVNYVRISVDNWCGEQGRKQTPHMKQDLSGVVPLTVTKRAAPSATPSIDNPFDALQLAIDRHLAGTPPDARNLTFTDPQELESVAQTAQARIRELAESFQNPRVSLSLSERKSLRHLDAHAWNQLLASVGSRKLRQEFPNNTSAMRLEFTSTEVVIPNTSLVVALVRFSFFYWVWYYHVCIKDPFQDAFSPSPLSTSGFFTFKPKAAVDGRKLDAALRELFKRCSSDIVSWSGQLKEYVNSRIDPLRKLGDIIE